MSSSSVPRLGLEWDQTSRRALVGYAKSNEAEVDQPVYATFDYTFDMGKPNGKSATKKEQPDLKMVLRCYRTLRKPGGVIAQTAIDKNLLVDSLKPSKNEWAQKTRTDFEIEFAQWISGYKAGKIKAGPSSKRSAKEVQKDGQQSGQAAATMGPAQVDPLQAEMDFFDVVKAVDRHTLQQAAKEIQTVFKLKKAPGIDVLESMRDWRRRLDLSMRICPEWIIFLRSIDQLPKPEPVRPGPDAAAKRRRLDTDRALRLTEWTPELEHSWEFVTGLCKM